VRRGKSLVLHIVLIISTLVMAAPIIWVVLLSFRPAAVVTSGFDSITSLRFTFTNYDTLVTQYPIVQYVVNSSIVSLVPSVISVVFAVLAAYPLSRFTFRGQRVLYALPLFAQIVPAILIVLPLFAFLLQAGLLNTYFGLIIAQVGLTLPLPVWLITGYLKSVPKDVEEQAMVDGCSRIGAIRRILVPLALPGIASAFMIAFMLAWGEFTFPYMLTSSDNLRVLPVALYTFLPTGTSPVTWGLLFAMATIFLVPVIAAFTVTQRAFRGGLLAGSIAGH
jgi:multiple sugar transport system permease protein